LQGRWFRFGVVVLAAAGCGLIDPNITAIGFDLPMRSYEFNADGAGLPDNSVAIPCPRGDECLTLPFVCEEGLCTAVVDVSQATKMNLGQEAPELNSVTGSVDISVDRINYAVTTNTLNIDLPEIKLYLAPEGVEDPQGGMLFGTVPPVPAGTTASGLVVLDQNASKAFKHFTSDVTKPFMFIAATTVKIASGAGVPSGRIVFSVSGRLSASL
jgi:hypothetical protein